MTDGDWKDQAVVFSARGTADKPITLRAATPGKAILTGKSSLLIDGQHLVVSGLFLKDGRATGW
jgi:poly(beta-D-mannuronate) lyase